MSRQTMRENIAIRWLTTAPADPAAPTQAEITAGTDIVTGASADGEVLADLDGWSTSTSDISVPDAGSLNTGTIKGDRALGQASLTYYLDTDSLTIHNLLAEDEEATVVLMPFGEGAGEVCTVVNVRVNQNEPDYQVGNNGATFTVTFSKSLQTEGVQAA